MSQTRKVVMKKQVMMVFAMCLALVSPYSFAKVLVGTVDIQKVLLSIEEGKSLRNKLEDNFKQKQDMLKKEEDKFKDLQQKLEKQKAVLNESSRATKEKELRELYVSIQEKSMSFQKDLQEMEANFKRPVIEKIKIVVDEVSKKSGVDMTFDVGASPLVYVESEKDLTEDVIGLYNQKYPLKK
jgi:outer membrane protein